MEILLKQRKKPKKWRAGEKKKSYGSAVKRLLLYGDIGNVTFYVGQEFI